MRTVGLGGAVLVLSCILAPMAHGTPMLMTALFLLGLGWSFCFLGASSSLSEGLAEGERGKVQGFSEALVSLSSGAASLSSGLLFAAFGFGTMTMVGLGVSVLPLAFFLASNAPPRIRTR
jgi:MFS family permease